MTSLPILATFDVLLSDEVVQDLFSQGKNFKRELVGGGVSTFVGGWGDGVRPPVVGGGARPPVGDLDRSSTVASPLQFFSVQLEKQSDTVIKLFITVYKTDSTDQHQQTELPATASDKAVQGDELAVSVGTTQTDTRHVKDSEVQTREIRLRQTFRNRYSLTDFNMSTQKDGVVTAIAESKASFSQTVSNAANVSVQTDRNEATASIQTDPPSIVDSIAQTDPLSIAQIEVQTDSSMARELDVQTQASVEINEMSAQTELIQQEVESQTEISIALRSDGEVQASAETATQPTQTDVEVGDGSSQTESSMSTQKDTESQCVVEMSELSCQTESQLEHSSSQTTSSLLLQTEQETQAATEMSDSFIQTEAEQETGSQITTFSLESGVSTADVGNDSLNVSQDLFTEIIDREDVAPRKRRNSGTFKDGVAQTDPVTIIIGDASFLVKKLKSSAISPSKITTSGNEIEIELSAEVAESDAPFETEGKENDVQRYPASHPESFIPRSGPMIRGGTPGVMALGAGGRGVRVRLPVTMQSPGVARTPTSRVQPVVQVRFQSPTVVRTQGPAPMLRHTGRNSTGGTFSCPFCSLIFIDSPALYEHLSVNHQVDQKTKWKQPKGREGKTIIPRKQRSPEHNPPVLIPVKPLATLGHVAQYAVPGARDAANENTEDEGEEGHGAGLFEDPVEMSAVKRCRGRPRTRGSDLDVGVSDDDNQTSGKRQRKDFDGTSKRARVEEQWDEADDLDAEEPVVVKTSRRGGRTPRSRTK